MATLFLGIGSNQGDKISIIRDVIAEISKKIGKITRCSSVYESEAWGYQSENSFYNLVIALETSENPTDILLKLKQIESQFGRLPKKGSTYADRPIDLDILDYENNSIFTEFLEIPHPRLVDRLFVLVPFHEIAPDWKFKHTAHSLKSLLEHCSDQSVIKKISTINLELLN